MGVGGKHTARDSDPGSVREARRPPSCPDSQLEDTRRNGEDRRTDADVPGNTDMFVPLADCTTRWLDEAPVMRVRNREFSRFTDKDEDELKKRENRNW